MWLTNLELYKFNQLAPISVVVDINSSHANTWESLKAGLYMTLAVAKDIKPQF